MLKFLNLTEARQAIRGNGKKEASVGRIMNSLRKLQSGKCLLVSRGEMKRMGYTSHSYSPIGALPREARKSYTAKRHPKGWVIFPR